MRSDFEEWLRRALQTRAAEITPDPNTWRKVEARIQRDRAVRLALSGLAVAAVTLLAVVAAPQLITRTRIELIEGDRVPARKPARLETPRAEARPRSCGTAGGVAAVLATPSGDLRAACAAGGIEPLTEGPEIDAHPMIAGGSVVWFDRRGRGDRDSQLMELDLDTGELRSGDSGAWPVAGPDGTFAYLVDVAGDGQQPQIVVRSAPHEPILRRFAVFDEGVEELSARHLTFDSSGQRLFWEAGYEGSTTWFAEVRDPKPVRADALLPEGATIAAPSRGEPGGVTAISRCCIETDGDRPTSAKLVTLTDDGPEELADLADLDRFDVRSSELVVAPAGEVALSGRAGRWLRAGQPAWLVGDGRRLFLVDVDGRAVLVSDEAATGAFNPALPLGAASAGAEPAQAPTSPTASPTSRLVTVQAFFPRDGGTDCQTTFPVARRVTPPAVLRAALTELLAGPTPQERAQGYGGFFSSATDGYLRDVRLDAEGVAHVDFRDLRPVIPNASSSCGSQILLSQLNATAMQFRNVKAVRYSINGDEAAFSEWLQFSPPS